jgi:hypothetical protein
MSTYARDQHRRLDTAAAEAMARDGGSDGVPDIARAKVWRKDATVSGGRSEAKVLLLELSERISSKGRKYMSGFLGKASVVAFEAAEPDKFGRKKWSVFVSTPQPRDS